MKVFDQPQPKILKYCESCMEIYEKKSVNSTIHKLHNNSTLVLYDIKQIYRMKLMNSNFCKSLIKGEIK